MAQRSLSQREKSALRWVEQGYRYTEIATKMGYSAPMIANILRNARMKLGVRTSSEAVEVARAQGLLQDEEGESA